MAKYLVFSDSHGRDEKMLDIIKRHKEAEGIFFLGDIENYGDRLRNSIPGPVYMAMTHGHRQHVNMGIDTLKYWALEKEADIVMYGHTHVPFVEQSSSMTILHPGSISRPRQSGHIPTYGLIDFIDYGEIMVEICKA